MHDINTIYFDSLLKKFNEKSEDDTLFLFDPKSRPNSQVIPTALADEDILQFLPLSHYSDLENPDLAILNNITLQIQKMQAGLGTSVNRTNHLLTHTNRTTLGSKSTDLFVKKGDEVYSIAELILIQTLQLAKNSTYKEIQYQELVNEDTIPAIDELWGKTNKQFNKKYSLLFSDNSNLTRLPYFIQNKNNTLLLNGSLTTKRTAPSGHALFGFKILVDCFLDKTIQPIITIGNGEDLTSTPDEKVFSWVEKNEIPIVMITTTKTPHDKKGGILAVVRSERPYIQIIEKAQAERANQLEFFEHLGLDKSHHDCYFNTNVVIFNTPVLNKIFKSLIHNLDLSTFIDVISPDLIQNIKNQDNCSYIQLEGAIGSVLLNLDKYFRQNFNLQLVNFLNYDESERELIFNPIKTFEDFESFRLKDKFITKV